MGFKKAGKVRLSKSGRALEIVDEHRAVDYYFYVPLILVKEIIERKRVECDLSLLVAEDRENV